jgi:undecaprenyl pyrophosphate phosphatase UppP
MGAGILKIKDITPDMVDATFLIGIGVSFASGYGAIRFLIGFLAKGGMMGFAVYRLLLGLLILALSFSA